MIHQSIHCLSKILVAVILLFLLYVALFPFLHVNHCNVPQGAELIFIEIYRPLYWASNNSKTIEALLFWWWDCFN